MIRTDRVRRAQEGMRAHGIDAYLVLTHDDHRWLLGEDRPHPRAIVPAQGPPVVVCFRGEEDEVRESLGGPGGVEDVQVFATVGQQIKDVVGVMKGLRGGRDGLVVAVQMSFSTPAFLLDLFRKANPRVRVVDVAPVMDPLRMVKEPEEIACMERAARAADAGMTAALAAIRPGVTELDVAAEAEHAMRQAGGQGVATPIFVNSGRRSSWLHGDATERTLEAGDLVVVDLVPRFRGYCANLCRTFVVGAPPSEPQARLLAAYERARGAALRAIAPGVVVNDVDLSARSALAETGWGEWYVPGICHGIGLAFEERPMPTIHPSHAQTPLVEGMTLAVGHSILAVPGIGGARTEDTYRVTAGGPVALTQFG